MRFTRLSTLSILLVVGALLALGCSGSKGPFEPSLPVQPSADQRSVDAVNSHSLWGLWLVYVDPSIGQYETVPAREAGLHANIRTFLEDGFPCSDCLKITSITPGPSGTKNVDIKISHPWADNQIFTGFDVRAIAMWNGSVTWPSSGLVTQDPSGSDGFVLNADGYTTIFNPVDFPPGSGAKILSYSKGKFATAAFPNSTLNPFIDYFTDSDRHFFRAGENVTHTWQIRMPSGGPFVLGYAVDASWEAPDPKPPVNIPDNFPIQANRIEPYRVDASQLVTLSPEVGSEGQIEVHVWDWQADPGPVWIECPDLWTGKIFNGAVVWDGEKLTANVTVTNQTGAEIGVYRALVGAQDNSTAPPPWDYTAYIFTDITVSDQVNHPPVAAAEAEQYTAYAGEPIQFHTLSWDPDGASDIIGWTWDFTNDGVWDWAVSDPGWIYYSAGTYSVDHMVTDKGSLTDDLEPDDLLQVTIYDACCKSTPIAEAEASAVSILVNEPVILTSYSTDPDGDYCLDSLEWDYDGVPGTDDTGPQIEVVYYDPGIYPVQLTATDTCGLSDMLDQPIMIEVLADCCQEPPVALIEDPLSDILTGQQVTLKNISYDPESPSCTIGSIAWDLDNDGFFDDGTDQEVTLSWDEVGVYPISLKAVDECALENVYTTNIVVHVGVDYIDDSSFKTIGQRYSYVSGDYAPSEAAFAVDIGDLDGPWDFTQLNLSDLDTHIVTLDKTDPEVSSFKDDFTATYEHFLKSYGIYNFFTYPVYIPEDYLGSPDRLAWVGIHEYSLGSRILSPTCKQEYPFWIFTDFSYLYDLGVIFKFEHTSLGYAEGDVTFPLDYGTTEFALVLKTELSITTMSTSGSSLVYEWRLDDGTVVATVTASNTDSETNYDPVTKEITGTATFNALDSIGPY